MIARLALLLPLLCLTAARADTLFKMDEFASAPHGYWEHKPQDRFSKMMAEHLAGKVALDFADEKAFLLSILKALDVPVNSQMLVFSSTSLQSRLINIRNPRGIFFNEDTFVGFVPGGRVEISSFDPEVGMIFQIFDPVRPGGSLPRYERSTRCMNCHADTPSFRLPGLVIDSIAVSRDGSSLETFRYDEMGHTVPLEDRFGGWHVTGGLNLRKTHANLFGKYTDGGLRMEENPVGKNFSVERYPLPTSDVLPQLVHEHQVGFINRVVQAIYLERRVKESGKDEKEAREKIALDLADYILFKNEARLPDKGIQGDPVFASAFMARDAAGAPSLREFNLRSRIFKHRCSYMLSSPVWAAVPAEMKSLVYARMGILLSAKGVSHLAGDEKKAIRQILTRILPDAQEKLVAAADAN